MKTGKLTLLDTNVLVYNHQEDGEYYGQARAVIKKGLREKLSLCVCPQVLMEFYSTITNPKRVSDPAPAQEAIEEVKKYLASKSIKKIYPARDAFFKSLKLLEKYQVAKQEVYDLQLVATMLSRDVFRICTFNQNHFRRFTEIEIVEP